MSSFLCGASFIYELIQQHYRYQREVSQCRPSQIRRKGSLGLSPRRRLGGLQLAPRGADPHSDCEIGFREPHDAECRDHLNASGSKARDAERLAGSDRGRTPWGLRTADSTSGKPRHDPLQYYALQCAQTLSEWVPVQNVKGLEGPSRKLLGPPRALIGRKYRTSHVCRFVLIRRTAGSECDFLYMPELLGHTVRSVCRMGEKLWIRLSCGADLSTSAVVSIFIWLGTPIDTPRPSSPATTRPTARRIAAVEAISVEPASGLFPGLHLAVLTW